MTNSTDALNKQLFQELDDKAAENCNGGKREVFTVKNWLKGVNVGYLVDGKRGYLRPGKGIVVTTFRGGIIGFDRDVRKGVADNVKYNLKNGALYAFRWNAGTRGNPFDYKIQRIG